jgi:hypothetical protein
MSNVHVLPDENLGGGPNGQILREYVEVDRAANVGDKIVIVNPYNSQFGDSYTQGTIMTVTKADEDGDVYCGKFDLIDKDEYQTLEPTDIVHIDDVRYRLVDRKAKAGDKIIIVEEYEGHDWFKSGETAIVENTLGDGAVWADFNGNQRVYKDGKWGVSYGQYLVLEPVEPAEEGDDVLTVDESEASKPVLDLLANLARRVTELERKLEREQEFRESLYRKISDMKDDIEMALDDIVTLDERTQPLVTKKPSVAVAVKSIQQEFAGVFTKTEIDAYVAGEGFCLNGTFEFKGGVKGLNDAAEKISEVFK